MSADSSGREASDHQLRTAFEAAPIGLAVLDPAGRYLRVNAELATMNGVPAAAHAGRSVAEFPAAAPQLESLVRQVARDGTVVRDVELCAAVDGSAGELRHWLYGFYPIRGTDGAIEAVGAWVSDDTGRHRAREQVRQREQAQRDAHAALEASRLKLQMGIEAAGLVMAEIDYRSNQNHISAELARLMQLGEEAMTVSRQVIFDRIHPDDRERYLQGIARAVDPAGSGHLAIDVRAMLPDGEVRWLHIRLQVTFSLQDGLLRPDRGICAARDVTAEMVAERRMRAAQRLAESVIEGAGALVYAKDLEGRYILFNQAWRSLHGLDAEQALGLTDVEVFGPEMAAQLRANDQQVARTGEPLLVHEKGLVKGQPVNYRSSKFPLYDEGGKIFAVCGVSTDITDVVEADRRKDEFLALLAHELRNPLAPIRTGLEILRRVGELPPVAARTRDMMERQLTHMVRLIDDLLDVSRISRGKFELRMSPVAVRKVLDHAMDATRPVIDAAGHQLLCEEADPALVVHGDLTRLAQVVSNLLNNAAKYTPRGGRIVLAARHEPGWAVVSVADDGPGIAAEMQPRLFELFAQAHGTLHQSQGGLGIGLWLVKQLVEMHGGSVSMHCPLQGGSVFEVRLPLLPAAPA